MGQTNIGSSLADHSSWSVELRQLYEASAESLVRTATVLLGRRYEAEEVVHDAFLATSRVMNPIDNLGGYLRRSVIVLRFLEDRTVRETAEALDMNEATVRSHCARGLKRLRKELS